jgi:hypothetical protein
MTETNLYHLLEELLQVIQDIWFRCVTCIQVPEQLYWAAQHAAPVAAAPHRLGPLPDPTLSALHCANALCIPDAWAVSIHRCILNLHHSIDCCGCCHFVACLAYMPMSRGTYATTCVKGR